MNNHLKYYIYIFLWIAAPLCISNASPLPEIICDLGSFEEGEKAKVEKTIQLPISNFKILNVNKSCGCIKSFGIRKSKAHEPSSYLVNVDINTNNRFGDFSEYIIAEGETSGKPIKLVFKLKLHVTSPLEIHSENIDNRIDLKTTRIAQWTYIIEARNPNQDIGIIAPDSIQYTLKRLSKGITQLDINKDIDMLGISREKITVTVGNYSRDLTLFSTVFHSNFDKNTFHLGLVPIGERKCFDLRVSDLELTQNPKMAFVDTMDMEFFTCDIHRLDSNKNQGDHNLKVWRFCISATKSMHLNSVLLFPTGKQESSYIKIPVTGSFIDQSLF